MSQVRCALDSCCLSQVEELFLQLVEKVEEVKFPQSRTGTLRCVRSLAAHHFTSVISFLLSQHMPYNR